VNPLRVIEAVLFASDAPVRVVDLARAADDLDEDGVEAILGELRIEYERAGHAFSLVEIGGGYQLLTRPEYAGVLDRFETVPRSGTLSRPALETLAIVAYRQPVGRAEIEDIRGVSVGGVLRTLIDHELIEVVGRGEGLGRPLLYGTTTRFLEHFGFRSLEELPRSDELPVVLSRERSAEPVEEEGISKEEGDGEG